MSRPARNACSPTWICIGTISMPSSCATLSGISDVLSVTILMLAMPLASSMSKEPRTENRRSGIVDRRWNRSVQDLRSSILYLRSSYLFGRDDIVIERLPAGLDLDLDIREALADARRQGLGIAALDRLTEVDCHNLALVEAHLCEQIVDH